MKLIILITIFLAFVSTNKIKELTGNYCNGNCPNSDCQYCVCGINKNAVDVNNWCKGANWDQSCCRCIVNVISRGNANFMRSGAWSGYAVGLTGIQGSDGDICGSRENYDALCNPDVHLACASKIYEKYGYTWSYWKEAKSCGCDNSEQKQ